MPALRSEMYGTGNQKWLGSTHGIYNCRSASLDISAFTEATHYPDGYIPSGTPVNVADESAVKPAGGTGSVLGFTYTDTRVVGSDDFISVPVFRHGIVNVDFLPVEDFTVPAAGGPFVFVGNGAGSTGGVVAPDAPEDDETPEGGA